MNRSSIEKKQQIVSEKANPREPLIQEGFEILNDVLKPDAASSQAFNLTREEVANLHSSRDFIQLL